MSELKQRSIIRTELLEDDLLLSSVIIDQVKRLRAFAAKERTEVDMSTLRISFARDALGLAIKTSALEAVAVGSQWAATTPTGRSLTGGPHTVLTIEDRGEPDRPWILVDDGWSGRLDYFHRAYARYPAQVDTMPKPGSYWAKIDGTGGKWRCFHATSRPLSDVRMILVGSGDHDTRWQGTVADFNKQFRRCDG